MQLRFTSLTVTSSREDLHLQECAHAGRTKRKTPRRAQGLMPGNGLRQADVTLTVCLFIAPLMANETVPSAKANKV